MADTIGNALKFQNFDPENIDVSEITELTNSIPRDGNVDIVIAEVMATKFLRGADRCSEFLSIFTWWSAKKDDEKRHAFSKAFIVTASQAGMKTATEKKAYAEGDSEYIAACEAASRAKAMKEWFKNKHESLVSAHYLMKEIAKGSRTHSRAGVADGSWGEQEWK